ncbi:hypothetical protein COCOBI_17-2510 [Coccomyxa sp. Obi]|nr:hypothetical protein COCOBI_17-2510 [Coccomyxa sp. Obi]
MGRGGAGLVESAQGVCLLVVDGFCQSTCTAFDLPSLLLNRNSNCLPAYDSQCLLTSPLMHAAAELGGHLSTHRKPCDDRNALGPAKLWARKTPQIGKVWGRVGRICQGACRRLSDFSGTICLDK